MLSRPLPTTTRLDLLHYVKKFAPYLRLFASYATPIKKDTLEMATAQRTRPRAVVGAPRRVAWQLKSALRHSVSAARRTIIFLHFLKNYCW